MRPRNLAALAVAAALAGCPIPQPLPDYPPGTITPPRILAGTPTRAGESIIAVPASCSPPNAPPQYDLGARIFYQENVTVEARWFVDYKKDDTSRNGIRNTIREVPADPNPLVLERAVPGFSFLPYDFPVPAELGLGPDQKAAGVVHVVELVVSNGFDPDPAAPEPNRTPAVVPQTGVRFEIQTYRWVFATVPQSATVTCPP